MHITLSGRTATRSWVTVTLLALAVAVLLGLAVGLSVWRSAHFETVYNVSRPPPYPGATSRADWRNHPLESKGPITPLVIVPFPLIAVLVTAYALGYRVTNRYPARRPSGDRG